MSKPNKTTAELLAEHNAEDIMASELQKQLGIKPSSKEAAPAANIEDFKKTYSEGVEYPVPLEWVDFEDRAGTFMRQDEEVLLALPTTKEIEGSILAHGQSNPVKVRWNQAGKLQIIDGWTRCLILRKNKKVSVTIKVLNISEAEAALMAGDDNFNRQEIPDYFKAEFIHRLSTVQNFSADKIAERYGVSNQWIYKVLAIFKFPPIRDSLKKNEISLNTARRLSEVGNKLDEKQLSSLVAKTANKELKITKLKEEVEGGTGTASKKAKKESADEEGKAKQKLFDKLPNGKHVFNKVVFNPKETNSREVENLLKHVSAFRELLWATKKELEKKNKK